MTGKGNPGRAPGKEYYYYYVCPHNPSSPRDAQQHPAHVRAAIRERVIHAAVDDIISGLMSADRRAMLAAVLPATQAEHDQHAHARAEELRRQVTQDDTAQHGLITQLEQLGGDTSPAANAMRQRVTDRFTTLYDRARDLRAQLEQAENDQPAEQDLGLIDELPYAAAALRNAPDNVKAMLYAAFDIQVLFRAPRNRPPSGQPSPAPHPASSPAW
jgi:hypothetical protein